MHRRESHCSDQPPHRKNFPLKIGKRESQRRRTLSKRRLLRKPEIFSWNAPLSRSSETPTSKTARSAARNVGTAIFESTRIRLAATDPETADRRGDCSI